MSRHVDTQLTHMQAHTLANNEVWSKKREEESAGGVTTLKIPVCPFASSQSCITLYHLQTCVCASVCEATCV